MSDGTGVPLLHDVRLSRHFPAPCASDNLW